MKIKINSGLLIATLAFLLPFNLGCQGVDSSLDISHGSIQLENGSVVGKKGLSDSVNVYLGIPFAAPPIGDLRWKEPQAVTPWSETLMAQTMPAGCIQVVQGSRLPWSEDFMHQGEISEDCLYLNVWTAAIRADEKRPVMVYIYGGGFNEGSNSVSLYDGEELAKKGVVLVGVNYRVGVLGLFTHPELTAESPNKTSGNYGLFDQVAALRWIRDNISAFGGDPDQVTIFGQSAGGMSVAVLMQSKLSEGLLNRAIIQSGPGLFPANMLSAPLATGEERGIEFAKTAKAETLADLRSMSSDELMEVSKNAPRFGLVADAYLIDPDGMVNNQVDVMNGFTADDFGTGGEFSASDSTVGAYLKGARAQYKLKSNDFLSLYKADSDEDVPKLLKSGGRDRARLALHQWAEAQSSLSDNVYTYFFRRAIPWPEEPQFGAFHTGEIPYVFNNLHILDRPWEEVDHVVADQMSSYFSNFAKTGDPNGPELPPWPRFESEVAVTMRIGEKTGQMPIAGPEELQFWTDVFEERSTN